MTDPQTLNFAVVVAASACLLWGGVLVGLAAQRRASERDWKQASQMSTTPPTTHMRGATAGYVDALRDLPADAQVLAASEALATVIAAAYPWREVADVTADVIETLPRLVAEHAERRNAVRAASTGIAP